jgi:hypothetical protein
MKSGFFTIMLLVIISIAPSTVFAKRPSVLDNDCDVPTQAPFDGGLTILLAAGAGYALKKGYDNRKKKQISDTGLENHK